MHEKMKAASLKMCLILEYLALYWEYFHQKYGRIIMRMRGDIFMTVSYSVNGKSIEPEELREIEITKKDYIDYVEAIRQSAVNSYMEQGGQGVVRDAGKVTG